MGEIPTANASSINSGEAGGDRSRPTATTTANQNNSSSSTTSNTSAHMTHSRFRLILVSLVSILWLWFKYLYSFICLLPNFNPYKGISLLFAVFQIPWYELFRNLQNNFKSGTVKPAYKAFFYSGIWLIDNEIPL